MAPLTEALKTRLKEKRGNTSIYQGNVDPEWTIAAFVLASGYLEYRNLTILNRKIASHTAVRMVRTVESYCRLTVAAVRICLGLGT